MTSGKRVSSPTMAPCKSTVHCSSVSFKAARCRSLRSRRPAPASPSPSLHIANLFSQQIHLPRQPLNLSVGFGKYRKHWDRTDVCYFVLHTNGERPVCLSPYYVFRAWCADTVLSKP